MNTNRYLYCSLILLLLAVISSCVKPRENNIRYYNNNAAQSLDTSGGVVVNEFVASGGAVINEFGNTGDWVELYNTGDSAVNFATSNYYITDDSTQPDKFLINNLSIPGKGYLVLFCDDSARILTQIHTNFNLSKSGEFIGLYKKTNTGTFVPVTYHPFGPQNSDVSEGRLPDGGTTWTNFSVPTPGMPNH